MTVGVFLDGDEVYVSYDDRAPVPLPRATYEARGYAPAASLLPSRQQYENRIEWRRRPEMIQRC